MFLLFHAVFGAVMLGQYSAVLVIECGVGAWHGGMHRSTRLLGLGGCNRFAGLGFHRYKFYKIAAIIPHRVHAFAMLPAMKRWIVFFAMGIAMLSVAHAQAYPARPVRVIVPSQAGGGADIVARAITHRLSEAWAQQVVVDNRLGIVGAEIVAKAAPDGYTLMFTTNALVVREAVYKNLPFSTLRDFQAVSQSVTQSNVLVANPAVPAKTVQIGRAHV